MSLPAGTRLGHYEVVAAIGAGGMGEVYKARDTKLDREVAIKVLPPGLARDPERLARFEREAKVLASLNHPNIAQIYGIEESSTHRALVMELVPGDTLKGPLPLSDALRVAGQIADALQAAHDKGIVHRDLKPANIVITPQRVVKVLDFGLAKLTESAAPGGDPANSPTLTMGATQAGMVMGTAAYMSPEQARGQQDVDRRADIWAFGVVLYEMLTGQQLFQGSTLSDILAAVLKVEPDLNAAPVQVRPLLERCLQKEPTKRLQAIGDWELLVNGGAGFQPAAGLQPAVAGHARLLPWMIAAALGLAVMALGVLFWRATRPVDRPLMRFSADLGPEAVEGTRIAAAISPDGTRLAFAARGPAGKQQLATRLLDQVNPTLLAGTENAVDPFFSPDSQWIGFFMDGKMKKISVQGGAAVTLCDAPGAAGASWGEEGWIVLSPTRTSGLSRVPEVGGTPQAISNPGEKGEVVHRWPQILPGGQAVLFTGHTVAADFDNASIEVLSLKTGQWKVVQRGGYFGRYLPTSNGAGHLVYIHKGTLFAVGFDLDRLEVRGTPAPLLESVAGNDVVGAGQYDVARNGTLIYLSGKSSAVILTVAWMESTGKIHPLLPSPGFYFAPRFSPDGKRLALALGPPGAGDIQVYDWQHDTITRLTFTQTNLYPVWAPDGKHIAFQSQSGGANSLWWIRADGAGEPQPLLESKDTLIPSSFSPDGQRLAFADSRPDTSFDLWTLPLDVSDPEHPKVGKPELFLQTPFDERGPAFSPDGRWIAYTSGQSGRFEVYVRPFPGGASSGSGKWQISTAGGAHPIWSRNGRELFYETLDNRIMVSTYTAKTDSFAADKPLPWSNTQIMELFGTGIWNLDLSPDGKRFAVIARPEATGEQRGSVHVTVLLNFFDELRRRVPAGK
jgi:Tol biopolymer transport system component/tRNA A-37 threonylcarbamoyl transferase component Bud32